MKLLKLVFLLYWIRAVAVHAQGLVTFANNGVTLITFYDSVSFYPMPPNDGTPAHTFYFGLLTAPLGTTDPLAFTFAGIYATNSSISTGGRFQGGSLQGVAVQGWATGDSRSYEIAGWSASAGHDWEQSWLVQRPLGFGLSAIGDGAAGAPPNSESLSFRLFGPAPALTSGFTISGIPEPQSIQLTGLAVLLLNRCRRDRHEQRHRSVPGCSFAKMLGQGRIGRRSR